MHHDHVLKKLNFDLLATSTGSGVGSAGIILATMLLHFVIPFTLKLQHDHILKKLNFDLLAQSTGSGGGGGGSLRAIYFLPCCCIRDYL